MRLVALLALPVAVGFVPAAVAEEALAGHKAEMAAGGFGYTPGVADFMAACAACHQDTGAGLAGVFPPLAGSEYVTGDTNEVINIVLNGRTGPITVRGTRYDGVMPPMRQLSDEQIAGILSYIRSSWGNNADSVSTADVAAVRAQGAPAQTAGAPTQHPATTESEMRYEGAADRKSVV